MPTKLTTHIPRWMRGIYKKNRDNVVIFPYKEYNIIHKCIFIHIPKNAGTSILDHLGYKGGRFHCSYIYYRMVDRPKFNSYFKFSIVRNPFDRLVSAYAYLKNGGNQQNDLIFLELFKNNYNNFESFVLDFLDQHIIHEIRILKPQYLYVYDFQKKLQVDFLGRIESLNTDFGIICNNLGIKDTKVKSLNKSNRDKYQQYFTNKLVEEKVAWLYKKDFEWLGYNPSIS